MLSYYLALALSSFRNSRALTALMVIAIGLGIAACMTTLTLFRVLSGDPIPHKSARLFNVQLDARPPLEQSSSPISSYLLQLTRFDAEALLREARGQRQVMMTGAIIAVDPAGSGAPGSAALPPFMETGRWTSSDFFPMFEAPLLHGRSWSAAEDQGKARVAVIGRELALKLFGRSDALGQTLRLRDKDLQIIGVLDDWRPAPHYFDLTMGAYEHAAQVYAPLQTALDLELPSAGDVNCWASNPVGNPRALNAPCAWLQYWVELESPAALPQYQSYLNHYAAEEHRAGRFEHPAVGRLSTVPDWLSQRQVVPSDVRLQLWLGLGFLLVCLSNTVGLLLAKCLRRSGEIGVRRALGASRRDIFSQFLVEAGVLGLAGGLLGLLLTWAGLAAIRLNPSAHAQLAQLDWTMLGITLASALGAALAAGLLPAWRACQVMPALQLKSQ